MIDAPAAPGALQPFGIPFEFILFALTLLGVALFHHRTLQVAVTGLVAIVLYKVGAAGFHEGAGLAGLAAHLRAEWVVLANLFGLLMGFALLSRHFEASHVPAKLPDYLPDDWRGAFLLLVMVFVLSSFLDNIAAALIGGTVAGTVFRQKVHIGYIAALVAASNAGGSGSVVGDTTTTMMWIDGVSPLDVLHAYVAAGVALVVCGIPAALQQHRYSPIVKGGDRSLGIDWARIGIVAVILACAIAVNVTTNVRFPQHADRFPFLGAAVWFAILATAAWRRPDWSVMPATFKGTAFLLCLVLSASMMPVEHLPAPSWPTALGLGFVSAVFDNIPLTKLALEQGGYDWGMLAYAVGFGGSMLWFGSSAGVAITNLFPHARSVGAWLRAGWHVALAYVAGFAVMLLVLGWHPHAPQGADVDAGARGAAMIRNVVFDVGGVLVKLHYQPFIRYLGQAGIDMTDLPRWLTQVDLAGHERGELQGNALLGRIAAMAARPLEMAELRAQWLSMFERWDEMFLLVAGLRVDYRVYLLSNVGDLHWAHLDSLYGIESLAHGACASFRVGAIKPSAEIYRKAESMFDLDPAATVFIDDLPQNVTGARNCGWHAIHHGAADTTRTQLQSLGVRLPAPFA